LLNNGKKLVAGAIYVAPKTTHGNAFVEQLGLETEAGPTGELIKKDAMGQTSVPGVFVAGDNSNQMHNATLASAAGVLAGAAAHRYLVFEYVG
jgi:thioredoxin reductase